MFAVLFPGQGSQSVGMAKLLYDKYPLVKSIFSKADEVLDFPISNLILNGPSQDLNLTENTQPAIFIVSYSIFSLIQSKSNIDLNKANYFAGHSLGEYSALSCAKSVNFESALKLLKKRGKFMQDAVPLAYGGMMAVLGIKINDLETIIKDNNFENCQIANDNCPGQIVVSGKKSSMVELSVFLKMKSIKCINLNASGPFHSKFMANATRAMQVEIDKIDFNLPNPQIISNISASVKKDVQEIKKSLVDQIEGRVRWRETIECMTSKGVKKFIEIGPGKVLTGLIKRIDKSLEIITINNDEDINNLK